jgi:hypothetical protein
VMLSYIKYEPRNCMYGKLCGGSGWGCAPATTAEKRILRAGRWRGLDVSSNVFVIRAVGPGRTIAHNEAKGHGLLSTLIETCASNGRGLAVSTREQSDV